MSKGVFNMSYNIYPVRCPKCNYKIMYNTRSNGAPYLMCPNSKCNWVEWNVPDTVMNDYDAYISDYELNCIITFINQDN